MKFFFLIVLLFINFANASPWENQKNLEIDYLFLMIGKKCNQTLSFQFKPIAYSKIYEHINRIQQLKVSDECKFLLEKTKKIINENLYKSSSYAGFQTKLDNYYFQNSGERLLEDENIYFGTKGVLNNFSYNLKITKTQKEVLFDESHISFFSNGLIFRIGKVSRWWSPSDYTSLILSNAARPIPSVSFFNYRSIEPKYKIFNFINDYDFEIFIGKLERDRTIPNALLFGNRLTVNLSDNFSFSLSRVAQYGGKGRKINSNTIKNMILGKDTINRNLSFEDQPGNQIAGIDFHYTFNKAFKIYGQYIGEDGLDPIKPIEFIGPIFPSKRFGMAGIQFINYAKENPWKITIEHVDTDTGFKNITYNHSLYETGYRYKGYPIGANIDADSKNNIISLNKNFKDKSMTFKYQNMHINENSSIYTRWHKKSYSNKQLSALVKFKINKSNFFHIELVNRDIHPHKTRENLIYLKYEHSI